MTSFRMINGLPHTLANNQKMVFCRETAEGLTPLINEQRKIFFNNRIEEIKDAYLLMQDEIKTIWNLFLAGEHPEYTSGRILEMLPEVEKCKDAPLNNEVSWCFHSFKWVWSLIWKDYQLENYASLCARFVLKKDQDKKYSGHERAQEIFEAELKNAYQKIRDKVKVPPRIKQIESLAEDCFELFPLDQHAIDALKILEKQYNGKFATEMIEFLQATPKKFSIQQRVESWKQPLFFHKIVGAIVWKDWVKKRIELLIKKPPALPLLTYDSVRKPMKKGATYDKENNQLIDTNGNPITSIGRDIPLDVPSMELNTIKTIISKGNVRVLCTINAHRLLRWEVSTITRQFIEGNPDARAIRIDGGFSELAKLIGAGTGKKAAEQIREIIVWQAHSIFQRNDNMLGNMLSYTFSPNGYKKRSQLSLILGDMMLPHYVFELLGIARSKREARKLIPIVDIPPLIGRPADQGPQANFQMEMMVKFRTHAQEFLEHGGVYIPERDLRFLANESGMPLTILQKVMERWTSDGNDAPAFLKIIERDRYALGSAYSIAQDFIISAGKKEKMGALAAKKGKKYGKF
jgi:hypothetical protein